LKNIEKLKLYDVVIIGSGIAGIICARELIRIGVRRVLILEASNDFTITEKSMDHYDGIISTSSEGHTNPNLYRHLAVGGTSRAWGGGLVFFEPGDFETRGLLGEKLWPISFDDLNKWRKLAANNFGLSGQAVDREKLKEMYHNIRSIDLSTKFDTSAVVFKRWKKHNLVRELNNIDHLVGSVAIDLADTDEGNLTVIVKDYKNGDLRSVSGKKVVIASGGIESTRFFLNSKFLRSASKNSDIAGGYYSPHISGSLGILVAKDKNFNKLRSRIIVDREANYAPFIYTTMNHGMHSLKLNFGNIDPSCAQLLKSYNVESRRFPLFTLASSSRMHHVRFDSDQIPNKNSRLKLSQIIGPDGYPRIEIDYQLLEEDWTRIKKLSHQFQKEAADFGFDFLIGEDRQIRSSILGQSHHLGALRMSNNSNSGIVDCNLEVFGAPNVFVLSGAVFPSYSFANPSFVLGALSCRLANFLSES